MSESITLQYLQDYIKDKDFQPNLKHAYFLKLIEEVGELADVIRKDRRLASSETIEEDIFDVLYYTAALANVYDIDLTRCFHLKEELNREKYGRGWPASENGG